MRKMVIVMLTALLVLGVATISFADTNTQKNDQMPMSERSDGDFNEMREACHGENGMMNRINEERNVQQSDQIPASDRYDEQFYDKMQEHCNRVMNKNIGGLS